METAALQCTSAVCVSPVFAGITLVNIDTCGRGSRVSPDNEFDFNLQCRSNAADRRIWCSAMSTRLKT